METSGKTDSPPWPEPYYKGAHPPGPAAAPAPTKEDDITPAPQMSPGLKPALLE